MLLAVSSFAVPPVDRISMLRFASARASSSRPVLSDTDRSARRTGNNICLLLSTVARSFNVRNEELRPDGSLRASGQAQLLQLLAQGPAIDSENPGSAALVAFRVVQHHTEQGFLDLAQHEVVQVGRPVTIQAHEVVAQCTLGVIA